jgi:hypothetical protein
VVWCGVVWCGVVWCGVVWCGVVGASVDNAPAFTKMLQQASTPAAGLHEQILHRLYTSTSITTTSTSPVQAACSCQVSAVRVHNRQAGLPIPPRPPTLLVETFQVAWHVPVHHPAACTHGGGGDKQWHAACQHQACLRGVS